VILGSNKKDSASLYKGNGDSVEEAIYQLLWVKNHKKGKRFLDKLASMGVKWDGKGHISEPSILSSFNVTVLVPITLQSGNKPVPKDISVWCDYLRDKHMDSFIGNKILFNHYQWYYIGD
jgi:hypothetical protein